jgi:hypothetical protein
MFRLRREGITQGLKPDFGVIRSVWAKAQDLSGSKINGKSKEAEAAQRNDSKCEGEHGRFVGHGSLMPSESGETRPWRVELPELRLGIEKQVLRLHPNEQRTFVWDPPALRMARFPDSSL